MSSLTEQKIESAIKKAWVELETFYDRIFAKVKPTEEMWVEILALEEKLTTALKERPLTSMQIRALMVEHTKAFKRVCLNAKESGGVAARSGAPAS